MVKLYGKDFVFIAEEMKLRFKKDLFFPSYCKELWVKYSNNYNWG